MNKEVNQLFVYGSLAPGCANEHVLKPLAGDFETGWVKGKLYEQGWGAAMGYPGIELDAQGEWVQGFLFYSEQLTDYLHVLDGFEGLEYKREVCEVKKASGDMCIAYIYTLVKHA
ncbi:gamma-glutamylcyclotransferase family protein [Pseudoalteromonas luteoviolacea]|uniref:Gamma-glutamylcyclotransferase AIG2-like domain-containing protein n=1 Tax=Pseudoalteromonas luteoviolacea S4054 TaxID=1129367 RepID=A0A0F6AC71_9GAMM|nr:gamma-glutamylcyclotransferase family protein [Pseudoalteromonas luteoviolacea]AOT08585.1 hypothetical protein S4054249_12310 [Pseudoalteromonas luteoviolacea]AOT13501.1 hypothetical protein S40542_12285 [Pseudoalteromonas luteoviolacea]AOT18414.1 hypothetical protein S4054_12285 [Pseudoalteromonas luteoviolacea]KKE83416.1 hypothetical protein N479_13680 [Pseudoalteromonas luteoviolacea S4054]KZN75853.1 hypothetical protein N481_05775 [Pseudoalteromonas luteoviolacea S4047-1]